MFTFLYNLLKIKYLSVNNKNFCKKSVKKFYRLKNSCIFTELIIKTTSNMKAFKVQDLAGNRWVVRANNKVEAKAKALKESHSKVVYILD